MRAHVELVFAHRKERMGPFVRAICLNRARTRFGLVNFADNMRRLVIHEHLAAIA